MEQNLVLHLCTYRSIVLLVSRIKKLVREVKLFILSGKVWENEFCKVVGTLQVVFFYLFVCITKHAGSTKFIFKG